MAEWQVFLIYQDQKSDKFWRGRSQGNLMEVNFGRAGSKGQSQVKMFDSPEDSARELAKQANAKRRKGYVDAPDSQSGESETSTAAAPSAASPEQTEMVLTMGKRKLELRLSVTGAIVRTVAMEHYDTPELAKAAFDRLQQAMEAEGYQAK